MSVLHCMTRMLLVLIKCREQVKVLHIIMKTLFNNLFSFLGWVLFIIMVVIISNMLQDEKIAMKYVSELESAIEADGVLILVLVEHTLGASRAWQEAGRWCLNPCFSGTYPRRAQRLRQVNKGRQS